MIEKIQIRINLGDSDSPEGIVLDEANIRDAIVKADDYLSSIQRGKKDAETLLREVEKFKEASAGSSTIENDRH